MKWFIIVILLFISIAGCESGRTYEEARIYFNKNEESFNRIEKLFVENNFTFGIQYYYYPIKDKKIQFEIWFNDSLSKVTSNYYLPNNFTPNDSSFIALQQKLNLNYDAVKELSEIMVKMNCDFMIFWSPDSIVLKEIQYKKDGFYGDKPPRNIKGKWYYYYKPML